MKTYTTERPVNSAAISPIKDHVILGGGQEAIEVNHFHHVKTYVYEESWCLGHTNFSSNR